MKVSTAYQESAKFWKSKIILVYLVQTESIKNNPFIPEFLVGSSILEFDLFVCVEILRPSQPNGVMSSAVSLPSHTSLLGRLSPLSG